MADGGWLLAVTDGGYGWRLRMAVAVAGGGWRMAGACAGCRCGVPVTDTGQPRNTLRNRSATSWGAIEGRPSSAEAPSEMRK